jgi:hypothetical protein
MIQPSNRVTSTTPMKPPMSGQYMVGTLHARVQSHLLAGRGERPRDLKTAVLAEHELQLTGRAQTVRMVGPVGRAWTGIGNGAQQVLTEEAVLTAHPLRPCARVRHAPSLHLQSLTSSMRMKADFSPLVQRRFPEIARTSHLAKSLQTAGTLGAGSKRRAISARFARARRRGSPEPSRPGERPARDAALDPSPSLAR